MCRRLTSISLLHMVSITHSSEESCVRDFSKQLMRMLGFTSNRQVSIYGPVNIFFRTKGEKVYAKEDVCVRSIDDRFILMVQESKSTTMGGSGEADDAEAQLIAEAVAAAKRNADKSSDPSIPQTLYGLTTLGTYPTFYRFELDEVLLDCISSGVKVTTPDAFFPKWEHDSKDPLFVIRSIHNLQRATEWFETLRIVIDSKVSSRGLLSTAVKVQRS